MLSNQDLQAHLLNFVIPATIVDLCLLFTMEMTFYSLAKSPICINFIFHSQNLLAVGDVLNLDFEDSTFLML